MDPTTLLVGIDGSDESLAAVAWTADLATGLGAEVVAVHAVGLLDRLEDDGPAVPSQPNRDRIVELVEGPWTRALHDGGIRHRHLVRDGNPVMVLLAAAEEVDADLLVVASRGIGGAPASLLGSTSGSQLAAESTRPVVIIPAATDGEPQSG